MVGWAFFLSLVFISVLLIIKRHNILLVLWSFVFMLFVSELVFIVGDYLTPKPKTKYSSSLKYKVSDPELVYWHKPNVSSLSSSFKDETVIFKDVEYNFDDKGRRKSLSDSGKSTKHALFFGGSFTFGAGVPQYQTLPSNFQRISNHEYRSYNYGGDGFGPGAMFVQLDRDELFDDIALTNGIAVYSFIAAHLTRSTAYELDYFRITHNNPFFFIDEQNDQLKGPIKYSEKDDLRRVFYVYRNLWKHSYLFRFISKKVNPKYISKEHATKIVTKIIIESKNKYQKRFDGKFYVLLWPRLNGLLDVQARTILKELLGKEGIMVIEVPPMENEEIAILHSLDKHPSSKEYQWVAQNFYEKLR